MGQNAGTLAYFPRWLYNEGGCVPDRSEREVSEGGE